MTHLTENEFKALQMTLNYEDRESQHSDNFSNAGIDEISSGLFNGNRKAAGGLVTSLMEKGLAFYDKEDDVDLLWLTEKGVDVVFDAIEGKENVTIG